MPCERFVVLYTHQKTKKSKVWQDGVLKTSIGGNKVTLFDDKGQCLESIFVRTQVKPGDDLEGDQYLITVEAEKATENNCTYPPKKIEASASNRNGVKPSNLPLLHLPVGLKRKFTGFKGPRQVEKRVATVEESVSPATSSSKWCQSPFSSKLYVTSPLFSAICKKQSGSSLPENSNSVVCASSAREDVFISSLVSSPYTNSYKEDIQNRNHCHPIAGSVLTKQEPSVTGCLKAACETVGVEVSQNIRSKAQIIALLKSKPTQQCREQKAEDIKDISRCQPSERRGILCKQNSTFVPEGANNTDIGSTKDTEHQYHAEITETNTSRWDVYMLPSSGGQSYDGVVMGKKYDQETNDASLTLQAPCHPKALQFFTTSVQPVGQESDGAAKLLAINGCIGKDQPSSTVLSESNINKKNNLKCASSSEAVYYARNADEFVTFETNIPKSSENSETDSVKEPEGFLAQPQINSQSRINVDSVAGDSGVPVCVTCAGPKAVHEDLPECGKLSDLPEQFLEVNFNLLETFDFSNTEDKELCEGNVLSQCSAGSTEGAVTQKEMRVHGQCEVMTLSYQEKDVKQLTFLGGTDENFTPECLPLQACVKTSEGCDRIERDAAAPSQIEVRCSDADTVVEDANRSTLNIETAISKNLDFYPACTINDMSLVNNKHTDLPVEFQGHQIKGSAASEMMMRSSNSLLGWNQHPVTSEHENLTTESYLSAQFSSSYILSDFIQVMSQLFSSLNPDSISLTLNSEENMIDIPKQESLTCGALPSDTEHLEFFSSKKLYFIIQAFGSPTVKMYDKSAVFHVSAFGPEDRKYETFGSGECMEKRQEAFMQPVFPNVASQNGQSKWLKYQNTAQCDLITQNRGDVKVTDDFCAENVIGMPPADTGESQSDALNKSSSDSVHLQTIKSILGKHRGNFSSQDSVSEGKKLSLHLNHVPVPEATQKVLGQLSCQTVTGDTQDISISELSFPAGRKVKYANFPQRKIFIPTAFQSHAHYKQIFTAALTEHLNILLFELSERLHKALLKVDISFYTSVENGQGESEENHVPLCNHKQAAKLVMVKKEGKNKGRLFYTCDAPKADQCTFFKWVEEVNPGQKNSRPNVVLHDVKSIGAYLRSQRIFLYEECQLLVRKAFDVQRKQFSKLKKFMILHARVDGDSKNKIYLKLSRREHSSMYSKDDLWVVSKTLNFEPLETFIACSAFFGPSTNNEVELLPLKGFCPSNWHSNIIVHALLVCNASTELTCLRNMQEYFNPNSLPAPFCLANRKSIESKHVNKRKFIPPALNTKCSMVWGLLSPEVTLALAEKMIQQFQLNMDQARALIQIAQMMSSPETSAEKEEQQVNPITIIHGVFGAGKSYLLSVVVLFLVQVFESSEVSKGPRPTPWKLLIAASTNVAVDRVLLGLLNLGFENFIRVGSIRKIAKPILPHSLHAGSGSENEQLKELLALMKEDLTPIEKIHVRKSIEQHKLGTNKAILQQVRVVGATCAACPFPCMNNLKFPLVVLDECSQMTEPTSLLPIARFQCEKLVLVGDPKQLPPTIQGSESAHENGLEQTLFDRLCLMGHDAVVLRTQYRCHPAISAVASDLFYEGNLLDGISEMDRSPLLDWLPILCFYNVNGAEQIERDNSFYNMAEAYFSAKLIQSLIASGIEGSMIGVITLYKSQMNKVNNLLSGIHSDAHEIKAVQVSTVDAFQGAEKEIIVLSCVRTRQVGFIDSEKRMNVALTRAKRHLLIIGNLGCLSKNKLWGRVIHHCEGTENGLQHVSQYERQLNNILQYYLERKKEEEREKQKEKLIDKSVSQKEV
uniref:Zinc finger GRF-type containing 1 n=1 Tax=Crocodylus porosus TaxID=8502 RepID=A0A7M4EBN9_CROPO